MYGLKKMTSPWHVTNSNETSDGQEEDNLTLPQARSLQYSDRFLSLSLRLPTVASNNISETKL